MNPAEQLLICGDRQIDGVTLRLQADKVASALLDSGLKAGDNLAVMLRNDLPYFELILATQRLGLRLVAINWHLRTDEAAYILQDCGAKLLVIHADLLPSMREAIPSAVTVVAVPTPAEIIRDYRLSDQTAVSSGDKPALDWATWRDQYDPCQEPEQPSLGNMLYTSGTTGRPKAVMRLNGSARQHGGATRVRQLVSQTREGMRTAIVAPLYHAGPGGGARVALAQASLIVVMARFDANRILQVIEEHRITHLSLVPIMFVRLLKLPVEVRENADTSSLESVSHGGSPCSPEIKRAMIDWWGPVVGETYGSTECGLVTYCTASEWLGRPGTVGRAIPGISIRILDDDGKVLPANQEGNIYVDAGDNALPFTYHNNEQQRREIERDGYITSGDVGYLDDQGFLFLTDRKRDMVISGGVNIYPAEIEHALMTCPAVADCAVFGIPDSEFGEALAVAVVPTAGASLTAEVIRDWLSSRVAAFKIPKVVEHHDALPREGMGKVFKNRLRDPHWVGHERRI